mgnify:CR=1 FL=1
MAEPVGVETGVGNIQESNTSAEPVLETERPAEEIKGGRLTSQQKENFENQGCTVVSLPDANNWSRDLLRVNAKGILQSSIGGLATEDEINKMSSEWPCGLDIVIPPDVMQDVTFCVDPEKDAENIKKLLQQRQEILSKYEGVEIAQATLPLVLAVKDQLEKTKKPNPLKDNIIRTETQRIRVKNGIKNENDYILLDGEHVDFADSRLATDSIVMKPFLIASPLP